MAPILQRTEAAPAANPNATAPPAARPQPVALEIPVTVNGARTVDGSDKRAPFSESTQTVLVFPHGAVIRITTPLVPGQLRFSDKRKNKKGSCLPGRQIEGQWRHRRLCGTPVHRTFRQLLGIATSRSLGRASCSALGFVPCATGSQARGTGGPCCCGYREASGRANSSRRKAASARGDFDSRCRARRSATVAGG